MSRSVMNLIHIWHYQMKSRHVQIRFEPGATSGTLVLRTDIDCIWPVLESFWSIWFNLLHLPITVFWHIWSDLILDLAADSWQIWSNSSGADLQQNLGRTEPFHLGRGGQPREPPLAGSGVGPQPFPHRLLKYNKVLAFCVHLKWNEQPSKTKGTSINEKKKKILFGGWRQLVAAPPAPQWGAPPPHTPPPGLGGGSGDMTPHQIQTGTQKNEWNSRITRYTTYARPRPLRANNVSQEEVRLMYSRVAWQNKGHPRMCVGKPISYLKIFSFFKNYQRTIHLLLSFWLHWLGS